MLESPYSNFPGFLNKVAVGFIHIVILAINEHQNYQRWVRCEVKTFEKNPAES